MSLKSLWKASTRIVAILMCAVLLLTSPGITLAWALDTEADIAPADPVVTEAPAASEATAPGAEPTPGEEPKDDETPAAPEESVGSTEPGIEEAPASPAPSQTPDDPEPTAEPQAPVADPALEALFGAGAMTLDSLAGQYPSLELEGLNSAQPAGHVAPTIFRFAVDGGQPYESLTALAQAGYTVAVPTGVNNDGRWLGPVSGAAEDDAYYYNNYPTLSTENGMVYITNGLSIQGAKNGGKAESVIRAIGHVKLNADAPVEYLYLSAIPEGEKDARWVVLPVSDSLKIQVNYTQMTSDGETSDDETTEADGEPVSPYRQWLEQQAENSAVLRKILYEDWDPYSASMTLEEFYELMDLFQAGILPLRDEDARPAKAPALSPAAGDGPSIEEPGMDSPAPLADEGAFIPRTMFLYSGLGEGVDPSPLEYTNAGVQDDYPAGDSEAYGPDLDPYNRGYKRPPASWGGVDKLNSEAKAVVIVPHINDDKPYAGDVDQELFQGYNGYYVRRVTARNTEAAILGAIKLSGSEYVYYYLTSDQQSSDVSTTTLPAGQKFIVEYMPIEHAIEYQVKWDSLNGPDIAGLTPETTDGAGETVNVLGTDMPNVTWEDIIFGADHPTKTDGGAYSFTATAPYGYTVEFFLTKEPTEDEKDEAGGEDGEDGEDESGPQPMLTMAKHGDFTDLNNGWALGMEPNYYEGNQSKSSILPATDKGPALLTMSGSIYNGNVRHDRIVIAVVHKNDDPKFLVAPLKHNTDNVSNRGSSSITTISKAKNIATGQVETNIPYDYEDVYRWANGLSSKYDYSDLGYGDKWDGSGASYGNLKDGNGATVDSWGWQKKAPYNDFVDMKKEDDGTWSYQWTFQTNSGDTFILDALGINGVGITIPFYSKYIHEDRSYNAGNRWFTEVTLPDGAVARVENLMTFKGGLQRVYRIKVTGARSNVTVSAMNLMQNQSGAAEFVVYELDGITGATSSTNTNHSEGIQFFDYAKNTWNTGGDDLGNTYEGDIVVEEKDMNFFGGDSSKNYANIRFKLAAGYDSPGYLWESTRDGVINDAKGIPQASVTRVEQEDGTVTYEDREPVQPLPEDKNATLDSQYIYGPDANGWYYIRVSEQKDYKIALLTIVARQVRYVVRYVPRGTVTNPRNMPTFTHNGEDDSFLWGTDNGVNGWEYDTDGGKYYDTGVDIIARIPNQVPIDPSGDAAKYQFVDWVLVDEDYNPIWAYSDGEDAIQVTTDQFGNRYLITPSVDAENLHHPALWNPSTNQLEIDAETILHWNSVDRRYELVNSHTQEPVRHDNWVTLTPANKLAYARDGELVEIPEGVILSDLLTEWSVRDSNGGAAPIGSTAAFHYPAGSFITLEDVTQYAIPNDALGGSQTDIYVLRLMPTWVVIENPFHYKVALNWVDAQGELHIEYFSEYWQEVLTDWKITDGKLTVQVIPTATPFQDWIAQHPTYTFWDAVNNNNALWKYANENNGEVTQEGRDAMRAEMEAAIKEYLPALTHEDAKEQYKDVLDALSKRDISGPGVEGNKGNGKDDFWRLGNYAFQVFEDDGTIVVWMYENKGGLAFRKDVQQAPLEYDDEFYFTVSGVKVELKVDGEEDGNEDSVQVPLTGEYKAYPEKAYEEDGVTERDVKDADAWRVEFKEGEIVNIVKNDGSDWPKPAVTYFTLRDGEGILLYVPGGEYTITETGSKSGGPYRTGVVYMEKVGDDERPQAPKPDWDISAESWLKGTSTSVVENETAEISQIHARVNFETGEKNVVYTLVYQNKTASLAIQKVIVPENSASLQSTNFAFDVWLALPEGDEPLQDTNGKHYYNADIYNAKDVHTGTTKVNLTLMPADADTWPEDWPGGMTKKNVWYGRVEITGPGTLVLVRQAMEDETSQINYFVREVIPEDSDYYLLSKAGDSGTIKNGGQGEAQFTNTNFSPGLTITQTVVGPGADKSDTEFEFTVEMPAEKGKTHKATLRYTDETGTEQTEEVEVKFDNTGKATVSLKNGQSLTFKELDSGKDYTVTQNKWDGTYQMTEEPETAIGKTPKSNETIIADFFNALPVPLSISKIVAGDASDRADVFTFTATFTEGDYGLPSEIKAKLTTTTTDPDTQESKVTEEDQTFTLDGKGQCTFQLKHGQRITFTNLPYLTQYVITENPGVYEPEHDHVEGTLDDTADEETGISEAFLNTLQYAKLTLTKNLEDANASGEETFHFIVELTSPRDADGKFKPQPNATWNGAPLNFDSTTGKATVTIELKDGVSDSITELLPGTTYTVRETGADDYRVTWSGATSGTFASGQTVSLTCTNTKTSGKNLTVSKTVTGNMGDRSTDFTFEVTLTLPNGEAWPSEGFAFTYDPSSAGTDGVFQEDDNPLTVTLRHKQSVTIQGLPSGTQYTIKETGADKYNTTVSGAETVTEDGKTASGTLSKDTDVVYTNKRQSGIPTDATTEYGWLIPAIVIGGVGLGALAYKKRKKQDEAG